MARGADVTWQRAVTTWRIATYPVLDTGLPRPWAWTFLILFCWCLHSPPSSTRENRRWVVYLPFLFDKSTSLVSLSGPPIRPLVRWSLQHLRQSPPPPQPRGWMLVFGLRLKKAPCRLSLAADAEMMLRSKTLPRAHLDVAASVMLQSPLSMMPRPIFVVATVEDTELRPLPSRNPEIAIPASPSRAKKRRNRKNAVGSSDGREGADFCG